MKKDDAEQYAPETLLLAVKDQKVRVRGTLITGVVALTGLAVKAAGHARTETLAHFCGCPQVQHGAPPRVPRKGRVKARPALLGWVHSMVSLYNMCILLCRSRYFVCRSRFVFFLFGSPGKVCFCGPPHVIELLKTELTQRLRELWPETSDARRQL